VPTELETYRANAEADRAAAAATNLPQRREQLLCSAEAWDARADKIAFTAEKAAVTAKAKEDQHGWPRF
jgi:hypothetical protein